MKYILVIGDGMADNPVPELNGKTPLQVANIPTLDRLASKGIVGNVSNCPKPLPAGSETAILSIFSDFDRRGKMGLTSLEKFEVQCTKAILSFSEVFLHIPCFGVHKNISKRRGLCYGNGKRTKLDVYRKKEREGSLPLFIYIHGGGYLSGIRSNRRFYCYNWVDAGYVAANIDYDYALDAKHPEHIREIF